MDLVSPPMPFNECPTAPEPGTSARVWHYTVEARYLPSRGAIWYYVRNVDGLALAMDDDWRRLCHVQGWYPMPGLEPDQPLPRVGKARERKPKTIRVDRGQRDDDPWIFDDD